MNEKETKRFYKAMQQDALNNPSIFSNTLFGTRSPTDVSVKGMYEYQEPEQDEQGTFYGHKILTWSPFYSRFYSPRFVTTWYKNGELISNQVPNEHTMFGIHFTKRPDHPELRQYYINLSYLVKCALSRTIIETEQGFRAEHAQILGVFINGNWTSYQDYYERARNYHRQISPDEAEAVWKFQSQTGYKPNSYFNPSADS